MRANEVDESDDAVADLVERMTKLMQEARGVGLAAPQVGVLRRVLVYQTSDDEPVVALVNPRLTRAPRSRRPWTRAASRSAPPRSSCRWSARDRDGRGDSPRTEAP